MAEGCIKMNSQKPARVRAAIPGLGKRSIKTALVSAILALVYSFFKANPTFACIGAIFGMGNSIEDSKKSGGNRLIGTVIGGFLGMGLFKAEHMLFPRGNYYLKIALVFIGIILLVWMSVVCKWPGAVQPGGVVLCIILFSAPVNHVSYALHRMLDTGIGVIFAIGANVVFKREDGAEDI